MTRPSPRRARRLAAVGASAAVLAGVLGAGALAAAASPSDPAPAAAAAVDPAPNPSIDDSCGIDVSLVLDASGSISSAGAVGDVRSAATAFLGSLADTGSTARVIDFGTVARETAPDTLVTAASVAPGGVHAEAIDDYYNPKPPLQPGVSAHQFRGGDVGDPSDYSSGSDPQYTNWDQSLDLAGREVSELVVFLTDGEPTAVDSDQPGDPFYEPGQDPPNVRYGMDRTSASRELTLDRAIEEANAAKAAGTRVLAVGVGDAFGSGSAVERLEAVSGPQVIDDPDDIDDLNAVDVALVRDFDRLAEVLRRLVTELCSPSLTIRKLAQTAESEQFVPTEGWTMTVEPAVATDDVPPYEWVLPTAGAPVGPQSADTDENGFAGFQWEPSPPTASSVATVTEATDADHVPLDYTCQERLPDGTVNITEGDLDPGDPSFQVSLGPESIVTCTLRNAFAYAPGIEIEKSNAPLVVRGDGGGSTVTSTYEVSNTGNTPLVVTTPVDDRCADVTYQSGDGDGDGLLDLDETWTYACDRVVQSALTDEAVTILNNVVVVGTAPDGSSDSDDADADVDVITPNIVIEKTPDQDEVPTGTDVTYTYEVHTDGNTPLSDVTVVDDTCSPVTYQSGDDGDDLLEPGETWTYTCTATLTEDTVNTATTEGTPPVGPDVDDEDQAIVHVVDPEMDLAKAVDRHLVLPGGTASYQFVVTNTGTADLEPTPPADRDTFVTDDHCTPSYVSGDVGDDSILDPGEAWTYACDATIDAFTINTASATATIVGTSDTLTRTARQFALPVPPAVAIEKSASAPIVYTGDDVAYTYEVTNPGRAPLDDVVVTDDRCAPVTYVSGDDGDGILQRGELWTYTCTATLVKADPSSTSPEVVVNTAGVIATPVLDGEAGDPVTDDATAEVEVIDPSLSIDKVASADEVRVGDTVTYTVTVTNTGDSPLRYVGVAETRCHPLEYQSGDVGDDGVADPGEAWVYTCTGPVEVDTTNTAGVIGLDVLGGRLADADPAEVTVYDPDIALTKAVDDHFVPAGDPATYTFEVTNTGQDPLTGVTVLDSRCEPVTYESGDDGDDVLQPGEVWTYTCTGAVDEPMVNLAVVRGLDHLSEPVLAAGGAFVAPYVPGIDVVKSASPTELTGPGEVTYTYDVTNTGNVPLADVESQITDDTCGPVTYVSGDDDDNGLLTGEGDLFETGPPEVWTFTCTTTVSVDTTNTVIAGGTPVRPTPDGPVPLGPPVEDSDQADVTVIDVPVDPDDPVDPVQPVQPPTGGSGTPSGGTSGSLPVTGGDVMGLVVLAVATLGLGAGLLGLRRATQLRRGRRAR